MKKEQHAAADRGGEGSDELNLMRDMDPLAVLALVQVSDWGRMGRMGRGLVQGGRRGLKKDEVWGTMGLKDSASSASPENSDSQSVPAPCSLLQEYVIARSPKLSSRHYLDAQRVAHRVWSQHFRHKHDMRGKVRALRPSLKYLPSSTNVALGDFLMAFELRQVRRCCLPRR